MSGARVGGAPVDNAWVLRDTSAVSTSVNSGASRRWLAAIGVVALGVASVLPFLPAAQGPFLFDDSYLIGGDRRVQSLALWRTWFTSGFWDVSFAAAKSMPHLQYWRPLVTTSFALDVWRAGGLEPSVLHTTNAALQVLVSLLTYRWLRALAFGAGPASLGALAAAWHPVKVESVAWISGRTDLLCAVGVLLVLVADRERRANPVRAAAWAVAGVLVAFLSKETAVILPVVFLGARAVAEARCAEPATGGGGFFASYGALLRAHARGLGLLAAVSLVYLAFRARFLPVLPPGGSSPPLANHVALVFESLGRYLEYALVPRDLTVLGAILRREEGHFVVTWAYVAVGIVGAVGVALALMLAHARRLVVGLALLSLGPLLPCLNVVFTRLTTLVASRFLCLSTLALAVAVALAAERFVDRRRRALLAASVLVLGIVSAGRASDFANEVAFWEAEAAATPDVPSVHNARIRHMSLSRRHRAALAEARQSLVDARRWYANAGYEEKAVVQIVESTVALVPDLARPDLEAIAVFVRSFAEGRAPAPLALKSIDLTLKVGVLSDRFLDSVRHHLLTIEANVLARLGRDAEAEGTLRAMLAECPQCTEVQSAVARTASILGDDELLREVVPSMPPYLRERAAKQIEQIAEDRLKTAPLDKVAVLASRGLHGRALRSYEELVPGARDASTYGELLARAGDRTKAAEVLTNGGVRDAEAFLRSVDASMGWAPEP